MEDKEMKDENLFMFCSLSLIDFFDVFWNFTDNIFAIREKTSILYSSKLPKNKRIWTWRKN